MRRKRRNKKTNSKEKAKTKIKTIENSRKIQRRKKINNQAIPY